MDERWKIAATKIISSGDHALFYREKKFKGPWLIEEPGEYTPDHPAVKELRPSNVYKYIIPIRLVDKEMIRSIDKVFDKLLFLTNKKRGRGGFSDHFQLSIISIRKEDYELILKHSITLRTL